MYAQCSCLFYLKGQDVHRDSEKNTHRSRLGKELESRSRLSKSRSKSLDLDLDLEKT